MSEDLKVLMEKSEATFKTMRDEQKAHNEIVEKQGAETAGRVEAVEKASAELSKNLELYSKAMARQTETAEINVDDTKSLETLNRNLRATGKKEITMDEAKDAQGAIKKYLQSRGGEANMTQAEVKLINGVVDPSGGYFMLPQRDTNITKKAFDARGFINSASSLTTGRRSWTQLSDLEEYVDSRYKSELDENTVDVSDGSFAEILISAGIQYYPKKFTREFLEDDELNVEGDILEGMRLGMIRKDGQGAIDGLGTNKDPLKGVLSYAEGVAFNKIERVTSTATGVLDLDDILKVLPNALKEDYHAGASFTMARQIYNALLTTKDGGGAYRFDRHWDLFKGAEMTFFNYPVIWDSGLSTTVATNSQNIFFGDNAEAYQVIRRMGFSLHKDDSKADRVTLTGRSRIGGGVKNFEALKVLKIK